MHISRFLGCLAAALVAVPLALAAVGPASAGMPGGVSASRVVAASTDAGSIRDPGTLPVPLVMNYTATISDQDTCSGMCFEWGYMQSYDFASYTQTASSTVSAQITLTQANEDGELFGSGPVTETPSFDSTGKIIAQCPQGQQLLATSVVSVGGAKTKPGNAGIYSSGTGAAGLSLYAGRELVEDVKVTGANCTGPPGLYYTTIQYAAGDLTDVENSTTPTLTTYPSWNGSGNYASQTLSGSVPWPVQDPPQADSGTQTVNESWTVGCPAASTAGQRIACIAELATYGLPLPGWNGGRIPYTKGGGHGATPGPSVGLDGTTIGLDCSGLTRWVYSLAYGSDVLGKEGTAAQITHKGVAPDTGMPPSIGDLVFYLNTNGVPHHVGILVSPGWIANETHTGDFADFSKVGWNGTPYYYIYTPPAPRH